MKTQALVAHVVRLAGITTFLVLCMLYPFLPGPYDGLAVTLSTMAQVFGAVGLLLVPVGIVWLVHELRKGKQSRPHAAGEYRLAMASLVAGSVIAIAVSLVALMSTGVFLGLLTLALWLFAISRVIPRVKRLRTASLGSFNPTPIYLVFIPVAVVICQWTLAPPATEFSRNLTINGSTELIGALEKHHAAHGRYPSSLLAVWKDYHPPVVGVGQFHYAPSGDAYNLFFEQPRFFFDNFGAREFVMYNKRDEHVMPSHASWILVWSPQQLAANQGWHAVHDTPKAHWKYFWFD